MNPNVHALKVPHHMDKLSLKIALLHVTVTDVTMVSMKLQLNLILEKDKNNV